MRESNTLMFEPFRLDVGDERLWRGEDVVRLTNKAFAVLRYLAEHSRQLVTKDELLDAVWPDSYVSEAAMTVCIRELRLALDDDARAPRFIETVRGRGYRFVAPVTMLEAAAQSTLVRGPRQTLPLPITLDQESLLPRFPFPVGRESELSQMHQWFAAARQGVRQVGFIVGEVGIGKTTLVDAFVGQLQNDEAVWVGYGQCVDQYGAGEPYLPVLEALGRMCRGAAGERLCSLLRQQAPSWLMQMPALLSEIERETLRHKEGGATQARMLRELTEAVELLSAERPLVLVLEDLHWSDASTLAWLGYLARRREPARLLVLATYRPVEVIVAAHPLRTLAQELRLGGRSEELLLDYLSEAAVTDYLTKRCPGRELPAGLAKTLHQRTDGNPLFLVTLVDTLVREGKLQKRPSGWGLPEGLAALGQRVPETLRQLIEQQLERVSSEDQAILEAASVTGVEFSAAAVAAGIPGEPEAVEAGCEALSRRGQFVQARGTATWPDGTVAARYGFLHALYPEVLYDRIPAGQRVRLHRQIGARLEAGHGEQAREIAAELAEHFVRGRDTKRAAQYLRYAGENARRRSAYQEAIAHLTKGLEVLDTLPGSEKRTRQEVDLQITLGMAYMAARGYAAAEVGAAYARALELCRRMDDAPQLGPVLNGLWIFHIARAELDTARTMAEEMLRLGERTGSSAALASAHHGLGQGLFHAGEFALAREHLEQALEHFNRQLLASPEAMRTVQDGRVICLGFLALCLWHLGYPDQAFAKARESLALARELSHPFTLTYALYFVASIHAYRGDYVQAMAVNEEMLALATEHGFPVFEAGGRFVRTLLKLARGEVAVAEGIARLRQLMDAYRTTGAVTGLPMLWAVLGEVQLGAGQLEDAFTALTAARSAVERTGEHRFDSRLALLRGILVLAQRGREGGRGEVEKQAAEAEASFRRAIEVARLQRAKSLELQAVMRLGPFLLHQGRADEVRQLVAEVYGWFSEGFDTADLQAARALLEELKR